MAEQAMRGKVCVVTGATSGIGKVTARELGRMGASVVAVARDAGRGAATVEELRAAGAGDVRLMLCDFASQRSIRELAARLRGELPRLDVLVNNAGGVQRRRELTEDGRERTLAVNHLGYFLLTCRLLDLLRASAPARIVNVASEAHRRSYLEVDDLDYERRWSSFAAYGGSKLANILFTFELARRLAGTGVTANCLHPGVVATGFGSSGSLLVSLGMALVRPFLIDAEKGARTSIYLASSPEVEGVTGQYFMRCRAATPARRASDPELARALWEASARLVGEPGQS